MSVLDRPHSNVNSESTVRLSKPRISLVVIAGILVSVGFGRATLSVKLEKFAIQQSMQVNQEAPQHNDNDCIFRKSPLYRSVYVYPSPGEAEYQGSILSVQQSNPRKWPWQETNEHLRNETANHYSPYSMQAQFSTELLVKEILTHPDSCLRTYRPEEASLFYVPYLPSIEFHSGFQGKPASHETSEYAQAISDAIEGNYSGWEQRFGLTSKYWKRKGGADHILVFSEPLQGLSHPRNKRGNYHYIFTQKQLSPPIVLSVELSTKFVDIYPKCSRKNILLPYPNVDGSVFNKRLDDKAKNHPLSNITHISLSNDEDVSRPVDIWYRALVHGECVPLRKALQQDYKCTPSFEAFKRATQKTGERTTYPVGMRLSTFCPCPAGDTPSAKRMFDAVLAGCIPVVLSKDFVWPFSKDIGGILDPNSFSLTWNANDFEERKVNNQCRSAENSTMMDRLTVISASKIAELRRGMVLARNMYSYYQYDESLPTNPLKEGILPNGGAAHTLVAALADRANGVFWKACEKELLDRPPNRTEPTSFQC